MDCDMVPSPLCAGWVEGPAIYSRPNGVLRLSEELLLEVPELSKLSASRGAGGRGSGHSAHLYVGRAGPAPCCFGAVAYRMREI